MRRLRQHVLYNLAVVMMVGIHLLLIWESSHSFPIQKEMCHGHAGQLSPDAPCFVSRSTAGTPEATIVSGSNKLMQIPQDVRVRTINLAARPKVAEPRIHRGIWDTSSPESFHSLPLHSLSIVLCQLRR
jgi:hypothetical protein